MQPAEVNKTYHKECSVSDRIPALEDTRENRTEKMTNVNSNTKSKYSFHNNFWYREELRRNGLKKDHCWYNYCFVSVCIGFLFGLLIGIIIMETSHLNDSNFVPRKLVVTNDTRESLTRTLNSLREDNEIDLAPIKRKIVNRFATVSFTGAMDPHKYNKNIYPKGLTEDMKDILKDNKVLTHKHTINHLINNTYTPNDKTVLFNNVFWGPQIENSMPQGYGKDMAEIWESYVNQSEVTKMEIGCGRMQNRLVTFRDGVQACVRYRQNTDQIQGEIFSFYVAKLLNLTNLAPSVIKVVDLKDKLWKNVANEIAAAQWNTNRAVVLTQYIPSLESATIPDIFKPSNRHLNKYDILKMSLTENETISKQILLDKLKGKNMKVNKNEMKNFDHIDAVLNKKMINVFVELSQWSDLIIFDYLTANLDRIVNNLFNYQWNVNIMDGPAHNLARKMDSGLLLFLDNESGLLHGYRLLKKYNVYHSLMLDNLCVFRRSTIVALKNMYDLQSVGMLLSDIFHKKNNAVIRDILPPLPEKNAKILHERIGKVLSQVEKCEQNFSKR